jgi:hydroxymethylbilane synthase
MNQIVIGTRGSLLARWQAAFVARSLRAAHPDLIVEEKIIVTEGDRLSSGPLWNAGGKGLWVKEIEAALLAREIDIAVHSMKDVPGELAAGLALVAIPPRADVRDAVVSRSGSGLDGLPKSARVGTTSLRRACQLKVIRPDLEVEILRGNLDTRLRKVADGVVEAAILACAGLDRLEFAARITERLSIERMLPAVGQGALAIEARLDDEKVRDLVHVLNDAETALAITVERAYLARLGATCRTPVAGYARLVDGQVNMLGLVGRPDGSEVIADGISGKPGEAAELGVRLADALLARGAGKILAECS